MDLETQTMANGLVVASARLPGLRSAAIGVWLRVGARHEPAKLGGLPVDLPTGTNLLSRPKTSRLPLPACLPLAAAQTQAQAQAVQGFCKSCATARRGKATSSGATTAS